MLERGSFSCAHLSALQGHDLGVLGSAEYAVVFGDGILKVLSSEDGVTITIRVREVLPSVPSLSVISRSFQDKDARPGSVPHLHKHVSDMELL